MPLVAAKCGKHDETKAKGLEICVLVITSLCSNHQYGRLGVVKSFHSAGYRLETFSYKTRDVRYNLPNHTVALMYAKHFCVNELKTLRKLI